MDWLCLSDGWYGLQAALLNLTSISFFFGKISAYEAASIHAFSCV